MAEEINKWLEELKKFEGLEVHIKDVFGQEFTGICVAINYSYLNFVLMTEKEKILIKNVVWIKRLRKNKNTKA